MQEYYTTKLDKNSIPPEMREEAEAPYPDLLVGDGPNFSGLEMAVSIRLGVLISGCSWSILGGPDLFETPRWVGA